ncbi:glycoside hydrolase family 28 protein, partial [Bacteroidota bacterium]
MRRLSGFIVIILLFTHSYGRQGDVYNIRDYGAAGDGVQLDTRAIQNAVDKCAEKGGKVQIPKGKYLTGTIYLKSNVHIQFDAGAILYGSTNLDDYPKNDPDIEFYGSAWLDYSLFYAENVENVTLSGNGMIDGQGGMFPIENNEKPFRYMNRPYIFWFINSKDILVEGLYLRNSALWMQHYLACENVTIRGINVYNHSNKNNDMIDIDGCKNVFISDCIGDSDDDGLTIKSTSARISENIVVTNCIISSHCNAIKCGTESSGGFRNITISNCIIRPSSSPTKIYGEFNGDGGIALEMVDGGIMENVSISNIVIEGPQVPLFIRLGNRGREYKKGLGT